MARHSQVLILPRHQEREFSDGTFSQVTIFDQCLLPVSVVQSHGGVQSDIEVSGMFRIDVWPPRIRQSFLSNPCTFFWFCHYSSVQIAYLAAYWVV